MACPFRRQVFVANSRELQSPTIGCVGDEDGRVDEVMRPLDDDDFWFFSHKR